MPNLGRFISKGHPLMTEVPTTKMTKRKQDGRDPRESLSRASGLSNNFNQLGINMVDLMMWLVIAALLLAAALQGIGFYQKAAWNYQLQSDAEAVRTYVEAQYTLNGNKYTAIIGATPADLKLTTSNGAANTVAVVLTPQGGWAATLCSGALTKANGSGVGAALIFASTPSAPVKGDC